MGKKHAKLVLILYGWESHNHLIIHQSNQNDHDSSGTSAIPSNTPKLLI